MYEVCQKRNNFQNSVPIWSIFTGHEWWDFCNNMLIVASLYVVPSEVVFHVLWFSDWKIPEEQYVCLKFCFKLGKRTETHNILQGAYGDECMSHMEWINALNQAEQLDSHQHHQMTNHVERMCAMMQKNQLVDYHWKGRRSGN